MLSLIGLSQTGALQVIEMQGRQRVWLTYLDLTSEWDVYFYE
jgi:hypothetical protein